nr:unnamed protein product [Spirometra erinaceieuropaei]
MGQLLAEELEHRLHLGAGTDWFDEQHLNKACSGVQRRILHVSHPPAGDSGYPSSVGSHSPNEQILPTYGNVDLKAGPRINSEKHQGP